jgi:hypothetical protein
MAAQIDSICILDDDLSVRNQTDSKDTVRIGMGLIGTLTALVLGLLIASAKSYYDTESNAMPLDISANSKIC